MCSFMYCDILCLSPDVKKSSATDLLNGGKGKHFVLCSFIYSTRCMVSKALQIGIVLYKIDQTLHK